MLCYTNLEYQVIANHLSASGLQLAPLLTHVSSSHCDDRGASDRHTSLTVLPLPLPLMLSRSPNRPRTLPDTGLCLPEFSGMKGSVSSGEPAPISAGCLGAESTDGRICRWLLIDVDGHLMLIRVCDCYYAALDCTHCL